MATKKAYESEAYDYNKKYKLSAKLGVTTKTIIIKDQIIYHFKKSNSDCISNTFLQTKYCAYYCGPPLMLVLW